MRSAYLGGPDADLATPETAVDPDAAADVATLARVVAAEVDDLVRRSADDRRRPPADRQRRCSSCAASTRGYGAIDVLFGVDLALFPGQVHALLGPNGAGKSTTLKVASAQITPTAGEVPAAR